MCNKMNIKELAAAIYVFVSLILVAGICGGVENGSVTGWQYVLLPILLANFFFSAMVMNKVFNSKNVIL